MLEWVLIVWTLALPLAEGAQIERQQYGVRSERDCENAVRAILDRMAAQRRQVVLAECRRQIKGDA